MIQSMLRWGNANNHEKHERHEKENSELDSLALMEFLMEAVAQRPKPAVEMERSWF